MKTQRYLLLVSIICISFLLVKCGKDGTIGPQGTTGTPGAVGPAGTTGATGPKGAQGPEGNANVKVDTFTVKTADWIYGGNYMFSTEGKGTSYYVTKYFDHNNSLITANLLISGLVLVYFQSNPNYNTAQWQPLPFSSTAAFNGYNQNFAYETFVGKVRLHFYLTKDSVNPPPLSTYNTQSLQYKIIVVSGTLIGSIHQNHINVNNYNEVSRFLGIR